MPIHVDDDTSSLSAILLNDDFYKFMMAGRRVVDGIGVLGAEHLIPFKIFPDTRRDTGFQKKNQFWPYRAHHYR